MEFDFKLNIPRDKSIFKLKFFEVFWVELSGNLEFQNIWTRSEVFRKNLIEYKMKLM
jgi:hypothetical protein